MKIPYYTINDTKHPSGKAHGGTPVIVRNDIKHYLHSQVNKEYLQATTVTVQTSSNYHINRTSRLIFHKQSYHFNFPLRIKLKITQQKFFLDLV